MRSLAVLLMLAASAAAQEPATFGVTAEAVRMFVTVPDERRALTESDFTVIENGRAQKLTYFSREPLPLDVVLLLDVSRSVSQSESKAMSELGLRFVRSLGRGDRMQIMHFGANASTTQAFTGDHLALEAALAEQKRQNATALRQAMYIALAQLEQVVTPPDCPRRRVLVVLTDGVDTQNTMEAELLSRRALESQATVFVIAVTPNQLDWTPLEDRLFSENRYTLAAICKKTGGTYFECATFAYAHTVVRRIINDLATQYALGWQSDSPTSGSGWRTVQIRITGLPTEKFRHPPGYLSR